MSAPKTATTGVRRPHVDPVWLRCHGWRGQYHHPPVSDTYQADRHTQTGRATDGVALDGRSFWLSATYEF
ncbi:hypothetical protein [Halomonas alkalisoli]|uniref:hypothetical protein n=1 Tax=Halomonas alkalisoli TaxID=2907158 RepID=UPI001F3E16C0|nr:hypothetical protein [Halomonas alkalisoli]MCE9684556.1 hypothetical protein [Halomonas alkalisoli]